MNEAENNQTHRMITDDSHSFSPSEECSCRVVQIMASRVGD